MYIPTAVLGDSSHHRGIREFDKWSANFIILTLFFFCFYVKARLGLLEIQQV